MEIEFEGVGVDRGGFLAVRGAQGVFRDKQWSGVIGANGSGKTTLLRALAGRLPSAGGRIRIDGQDRGPDRLWRAMNIGFAPDVSALPPGLTARQYLGLARRTAESADVDRQLARLRDALRFEPFADRPIGALSAGMRQRICLYSAFIDLAETVILDEPFNWLDPVCAHDTKAALRELVGRRELTLITALHEMSTLTVYCDAGLLMSDGLVVRRVDGEELRRGAGDIAAFEASIVRDLRSGTH